MPKTAAGSQSITIRDLLRPHTRVILLGLVAVIGEGIANLLEPWPLKIVLDNVLKSRSTHGWLNHLILRASMATSSRRWSSPRWRCWSSRWSARLCSYIEKYVTTSVGQWVMHDLRRTLYSHIQRLSLAYHDHKQTGDLISRVTSDIDAIQSFITSGLLGALINGLTLVGHGGRDVVPQLAVHADRAFGRAAAVRRGLSATRAGSRRPRARCARRKARSFR